MDNAHQLGGASLRARSKCAKYLENEGHKSKRIGGVCDLILKIVNYPERMTPDDTSVVMLVSQESSTLVAWRL